MGDTYFFVREKATGEHVQVFAHELRLLDVNVPRRAREWFLAIAAIPMATAALVGFARLPWVKPEAGVILAGFLALLAIGTGVVSVPFVRKPLGSWLTRWQRLHPPSPS